MTSKNPGSVANNVIQLPAGRFVPEPQDIKDWDSLWRIPPKDHRGHKESIQFNMPPQLFEAAVRVVKSGLFPAEDPSSFGRTAWKLLLDLCFKIRPELEDSTYRQALAIIDILREEEMAEEFNLVFTRMRTMVDQWLNRGDMDQARRVLMRIMGSVRQMPMGYHKNRYLTEMEKQYAKELEPYGIDWAEERRGPVCVGDFLKQHCNAGEDPV